MTPQILSLPSAPYGHLFMVVETMISTNTESMGVGAGISLSSRKPNADDASDIALKGLRHLASLYSPSNFTLALRANREVN